MKILFTCVGRRIELIQCFRIAAAKLEQDLCVCGADISETAPALWFCDKKFIVPRIRNAEYIPTLLKICKEEKVDALIPTIDTDLLILAQHADMFQEIGTRVIISKPDGISICRDKRKTAQFFAQVGLLTPVPVDDWHIYDAGYPAFIKPKDGSSSIFAYKVSSVQELETYARQVPEYIVQPYIEGTEYTVDVLCDWEGNPIHITPRIRMEVRAGEVLKTQISQDETIIEEIRRMIAYFKPCGPVTVQLIKQRESGKNWYIEINPRFGGGAPLSMKAGADSADAVIRLLRGEKVEYISNAACDGAIFSRFDQSVRVK